MTEAIRLGSREIGPGTPCFVIAEAGVNHNGDVAIGHRLIDAAADAGADAVKFQNFFAEDLVTRFTPKAAYQVDTTGSDGGQFAMLKALELTFGQQAELKAHCDERGILYLCTPYEPRSADMLEAIGVAAYKVASTDTTNLPFLRYLASKGRPLILSTGMCGLGEVESAVDVLRQEGMDRKVALLHCLSEYPAPVDQLNLRAMKTLECAFGWPVGYSDHTPGVGASPWAVALGACIIEKHFTLDRGMIGPDHRASLEPDELSDLITQIRAVEAALGDGIKRVMPAEAGNKPVMQKSLVTRTAFAAGSVIVGENLTAKRPGTGIPPAWFDRVVGRHTRVDIPADTVLTLDMIEWTDA